MARSLYCFLLIGIAKVLFADSIGTFKELRDEGKIRPLPFALCPNTKSQLTFVKREVLYPRLLHS